MPPTSRKRRAPVDDDDDPPPTQTQQHRRPDTPDDDEEVDEAEEESGSSSIAQLSKNFVRYALACEYARIPIKRQDITQKVLGTHARSFKPVFDAANSQLMDIFGMMMVELPNKEKVTMRQKRAAAASESQPKNSNTWVLQTILPERYRKLDVIGPGREPEDDAPDLDGSYIGLYSMIIALILLSGGTLSENKLDRFMKRMNAGETTPLDTTDRVLARMQKDGYIVKIKDSSSGEEVVDYMVGPRGKVEVGKEGVANLVRHVYGHDIEDLEQRLTRSLGLGEERDGGAANGEEPAAAVARRPGRPRKQEAEDD
ncbi:hypothetical protein N0V90_000383 [Kalmusia sp. IMI 367209]|nr:hypothetical protein N0V90_000383 [Kalmusia sp. IMI 367209]